MTTITATCYEQGTLTLSDQPHHYVDSETVQARGLADYEIDSPESLHKLGARYDYVKRPGLGLQPGDEYTLRKAKNDWQKLTT